MKIKVGKTYKEANGLKFRIVSNEGIDGYEFIGVCDNIRLVIIFSMDGTSEYGNYVLISEYHPWGGVKVDTPIWVRDHSDDQWQPRHFAMHFNGKTYAWSNGGTSHSSGYTIDGNMDDFVTYWEKTTLVNPNKVEGE